MSDVVGEYEAVRTLWGGWALHLKQLAIDKSYYFEQIQFVVGKPLDNLIRLWMPGLQSLYRYLRWLRLDHHGQFRG